jgi:hypothetical protein
MAYQVDWIVRHHILYITFTGDITLEDFQQSSKIISDEMDAAYAADASGIIIGIVDLREASLGRLLRLGVAAAQDISGVLDPRVWKAKPGFVVLITLSDTARLLTSILIKLSKQPMTTVGTMPEALTVVSYMYPELQSRLDAFRDSQPSAGS